MFTCPCHYSIIHDTLKTRINLSTTTATTTKIQLFISAVFQLSSWWVWLRRLTSEMTSCTNTPLLTSPPCRASPLIITHHSGSSSNTRVQSTCYAPCNALTMSTNRRSLRHLRHGILVEGNESNEKVITQHNKSHLPSSHLSPVHCWIGKYTTAHILTQTQRNIQTSKTP